MTALQRDEMMMLSSKARPRPEEEQAQQAVSNGLFCFFLLIAEQVMETSSPKFAVMSLEIVKQTLDGPS